MKIRLWPIVFLVIIFVVAQNVWGLTYDIEGENSSGANDSKSTAQNIGTLSGSGALTVQGWVDADNSDDVDFYSFSVTSSLDLFFDIDGASTGDYNTGLDAILSIFNGSDQLIAYSDDHWKPDPGSTPVYEPAIGDWLYTDSFIGALTLAPGTYCAVVSSFASYPNAVGQWGTGNYSETWLSENGWQVSGATPDATVFPDGDTSGAYQLQIRQTMDDQPVGEAPVPEPSTVLLFGIGTVAVAGFRRKFRS